MGHHSSCRALRFQLASWCACVPSAGWLRPALAPIFKGAGATAGGGGGVGDVVGDDSAEAMAALAEATAAAEAEAKAARPAKVVAL